MATELFESNLATTTIAAGADAAMQGAQETWVVASSVPFGDAQTGVSQFHVADPAAQTEMIAVTNVSSETWTVTRGAENTTPVEHAPGFSVVQVTTAGWLSAVATAIGDVPSLPVTVPEGGTGGTALSAYALLTGGTASSTPVQQVSGTGTSGYVLTSNGAAALPTWQPGSGGSASTAGYLADISGSVAVFASAAPTSGYVLTATSGTTATWQQAAAASGSTSTAGYLADVSGTVAVYASPAPSSGYVLTATSGTTATWQQAAGGSVLTRVLVTAPSGGVTHTALPWELTAVSTASGAGTVLLPTTPAAGPGTQNAVKMIVLGGSNTVTILTQGTDVFSFTGGGTTNSLTLAGQAALMQYNGSGIWTIFADDLPASQIVILNGDLGGTSADPQVVSTHFPVTTNASAAGIVNLDPTSTRVFSVTQASDVTFTFNSATTFGSGTAYSFELYLNQNAAGTHLTTFPASVSWLGGTVPTLNTAGSALNLLAFETINAGTAWTGSLIEAPVFPLAVTSGGTGNGGLSPYALLTGGVTNSSPVQTVSGSGLQGELLTGIGSGTLPTWQQPPGVSGVTAASLNLGLLSMQPHAVTSAAGNVVPAQDLIYTLCTAAQTQTVNYLGCFVTLAGVTTGTGVNAVRSGG